MKKILFAFMAFATLFAVSCNKEDEKTEGNTNGNTAANASIEGRWDAPRSTESPDDIAFVAIFAGENLDLYVIPWGEHMRGTFTLTDGLIDYNITEAYNASSVPVHYDEDGIMTQNAWEAGNLDATTLELSAGYNWYTMRGVELNRVKGNFGQFEFTINGNTATSTMGGIHDLVFHKVQ